VSNVDVGQLVGEAVQFAPLVEQIIAAIVKAVREKGATVDAARQAALDAATAYVHDDLASGIAEDEAKIDAGG